MTLTAQTIIDNVRGVIKDEEANSYRWADSKMFNLINKGMTEIVKLAPDANLVRASRLLTTGSALHDLPPTAIELLDVPRNMGVAGTTPGAVINETSLDMLDRSDRNWQTQAGETDIQQWTKHPAEKRRFFTYPPAHASTAVYVEVLYSDAPADVTQLGDTVGIHGVYQQQLEWFMAGSILVEDDPNADFPRGAALLETFYQSLGSWMKKSK